MKVAIPHWRGRVSPVFDAAGSVLIVEIEDGAETARQDVAFDTEDPQRRATQLARAGADVLVCGAISWPLEMALSAEGIDVIPQTCGDVEQVLAAFASGALGQDAFLMPGCCGRRRRATGDDAARRCRRRGGKGGEAMPGGDGAGPPRDGGRRRGRKGAPPGAGPVGPAGQCVCPSCGHRVPHVTGQPCNQKACPACGQVMTRG